MKPNDVVLQTITTVAAFIIVLFSIQLFFAGHYNPGGGFIGGLLTSGAIVLLLLAFDIKTVSTIFPFDYKIMTAIGLLLSVGTGAGALLFDVPFLTHAYEYFHLPLLGEQSLHTAVIFDTGVYLVVIGITMTIIQTIGESE
ncbi:monovalent cation/H+ antiporter subunit B [Bacillus coahuilensis p1.1.43]|uniref:Monovalent cation/H+ antiporter subunit B n=1 Tax=Bacillus coahuilensis p1.1.43 TaxID=1150625 RepID=A0A147K6B8_9BACI|nr:Na(+)/H(+) antiporter subunit B [Bacillus coahuilensis]KUP05386.1 monovalent cation/H+ antiporter subunit B [Bacillus coahuilensis p1.1.43]